MKDLWSDQQLLALTRDDDRAAFEIIYRRYWYSLYKIARQRLRDHELSEDIVQEIFIRLWERRGDLKIDNLSAYLQTAVRYRVYNCIARDIAPDAIYKPFDGLVAASAVADCKADGIIIEKELLGLVQAYINTLPEKRQRIFNLYFDDNLSTGEIAGRLNISQKTVQNQLGTAIKGLRAHLLPVSICMLVLASSL